MFLVFNLFLRSFIVICLLNLNLNSKKCSSIKFTKAKFSEEGLTIKDILTERYDVGNDYPKHIMCNVDNIFFSFDGSESVLNQIILEMNYSLNWKLSIYKISLYNNCFEIYNFDVENNKSFFVKARKISNVGKISALEFDSGYREPMGWKFSSKMVTYNSGEIFFFKNKVGFGKSKIGFLDLNFSTKNRSGFIFNSCFSKDFYDYRYFSFGYYFLPQNEKFDFMIAPMIYLKDLGVCCEFRDLVHDASVSIKIERGLSCLVNKIRQKKAITNSSNVIIDIKSNNSVLDMDLSILNRSFYNKNIYQSMNYQNFLRLDKDYWGYAYLNCNPINLAFLQRNDENAFKVDVGIIKNLKLQGERSFDDKTTLACVLSKKNFFDFDLFLLDLRGEAKYTFFKDENFIHDVNALILKSGFKLDGPMFFFCDNVVRFAISFDINGVCLDFVKFGVNKFNTGKRCEMYRGITCKASVELSLEAESFDAKIFFKDEKNFGIELSNFGDFCQYFDSISVELENNKPLLSILFLNQFRSYGIKLSSNQLLFEFLFVFQDFIKFKGLGSYGFKKKVFDKNNFKDNNTYINFGIVLMTQSWELSFAYGIRNTSSNIGNSSLYYISLVPKVQLSFKEIEEIFIDLNLEKEKVLSLYDDFK